MNKVNNQGSIREWVLKKVSKMPKKFSILSPVYLSFIMILIVINIVTGVLTSLGNISISLGVGVIILISTFGVVASLFQLRSFEKYLQHQSLDFLTSMKTMPYTTILKIFLVIAVCLLFISYYVSSIEQTPRIRTIGLNEQLSCQKCLNYQPILIILHKATIDTARRDTSLTFEVKNQSEEDQYLLVNHSVLREFYLGELSAIYNGSDNRSLSEFINVRPKQSISYNAVFEFIPDKDNTYVCNVLTSQMLDGSQLDLNFTSGSFPLKE